jgi:hypothetical protein
MSPSGSSSAPVDPPDENTSASGPAASSASAGSPDDPGDSVM